MRADKVKHFLDSGFFFYNEGRVYRTKRINSHQRIVDLPSPKIASHETSRGYRRVSLEPYTVYEHVLIYALVYGLEALTKVECIDHLNADKSDNKIENLDGVTLRENNERAERMGLVRRTYGEVNGTCKVSSETVTQIKNIWQTGRFTQREIARLFSISQSHVCNIVKGKARRFG